MIWVMLLIGVAAFISWYKTKLTDTGRMITKGILIYVSAFGTLILLAALIMTIIGTAEDVKDYSVKEREKTFDRNFYDGEYADLRENLSLYDGFEPEFDRFWEIAEADELVHDYELYGCAAAEEPGKKKEYLKKREECREKVSDILKNSTFEENKETLARFADSLKDG